jgi:hypothetical protein
MATANLLLHIDEELDQEREHQLTATLEGLPGVTGTRHDPTHAHLFVVDYEPGALASGQLLEAAREVGLHGELVGL